MPFLKVLKQEIFNAWRQAEDGEMESAHVVFKRIIALIEEQEKKLKSNAA